jgi:hypothetical protein
VRLGGLRIDGPGRNRTDLNLASLQVLELRSGCRRHAVCRIKSQPVRWGVSSVCCGPRSRARPNPGLVDCSVVVELPVLRACLCFWFQVPGSELQVTCSCTVVSLMAQGTTRKMRQEMKSERLGFYGVNSVSWLGYGGGWLRRLLCSVAGEGTDRSRMHVRAISSLEYGGTEGGCKKSPPPPLLGGELFGQLGIEFLRVCPINSLI